MGFKKDFKQFQRRKVETETDLKRIKEQIEALNNKLQSANVETLNNQYEAKIRISMTKVSFFVCANLIKPAKQRQRAGHTACKRILSPLGVLP